MIMIDVDHWANTSEYKYLTTFKLIFILTIIKKYGDLSVMCLGVKCVYGEHLNKT